MGQWFNGDTHNLATIARETGYPVVEVDGWKDRGHGAFADHVGVVVLHHTAGPEPEDSSSNFPSLNVVTHGRSDLEGPLAHYGIGYDGAIYVIAAGVAWHAGSGGWNGFSGNETAIGIEAEDSGDGDWTPEQLDAYPRLVARICWFLGISEAGVCGHQEWAPDRKIDPAGIDMNSFREEVAYYLANPEDVRKEDMTYEDIKNAVREVLDEDRYTSRVGDSTVKLSLADSVLDTNSFAYELRHGRYHCGCKAQ